MARTAPTLRLAALVVAGGPFLLSAGPVPAAQNPAPANSASLNISPIRVEIDSEETGATVRIANDSDREIPVQSRLFSWSQVDGEDVYAPSADMIVSPAISTVPAGETQIVRVTRKGPSTPGEKRLRLIVDQLPDNTMTNPGQAKTRIRFAVPVFVDRDKSLPAQLSWSMQKDRLVLANAGGQTARILSLKASVAGGKELPLENASLRYVLGKSAISWPVGNGCSLGQVRVTADIDGQAIEGIATPSCS